MAKSMKPGGGGRFAKMEKGLEKMQEMAAAGKKRAAKARGKK